jgi:hypothetical protein
LALAHEGIDGVHDLGMGSGDLVINTSGAPREHLQIPNVLFLNRILASCRTWFPSPRVTVERGPFVHASCAGLAQKCDRTHGRSLRLAHLPPH